MNKTKIIFVTLFLFSLFSLFKIIHIDVNARCSNNCYNITGNCNATDTCGGGGTCNFVASGTVSCTAPAVTYTDITFSKCQSYINSYGGGTCGREYECPISGRTFTDKSVCENICSGPCSLSSSYYYYHHDAYASTASGICNPHCPSGYHPATSGETSSCSVTCGACCNSVGCVKDSVYYCSGTTCASSTYASVAACTAAFGESAKCSSSPVCNNQCAPITNPTYYYCNGTCFPTTDYATLSACNAALDSCHTSSNCDGECGNSWYFCRTDTTPQSCQATSATYATQTACNAALVKNWEGQTLNDTCYQFSSTCNSVCQDTDQCVTHDCSYIQGSCGPASGKSFSSSPTSYLCADGQVPIVYTSKNNFFWTCPATIVN